jgi:hypothetical protein
MRLLAPFLLIPATSLLAAPPPVSFNRDIRPLMSDTCFHCHGFDPKTREASLRLDIREEAIKKTEEGTLPIVPGDPDKSEIITRIFDDEDPMPPEKAHKPFTTAQKELFRRWVAEGAVYEPHWAYTPLTKPTPPKIADHPIDAFIQTKLAEKNLSPSPKAPDPTLLRRLSLDLTGLPPSKASSSDPQSAIDSLLASPHFGERMAVWWLDIARFADTVGFHGDQNQRIFPYRDYVINAFNQNKPFDQFTREQLAGDLLPKPTTEQLTATGYNRLNMMTREGGAQAREYLAKYGAERVRSVAAAFFGSTFGCAECHDHKFDPIKTRDFYELQSFFADVKQWGVYSNYSIGKAPELEGFNNEYPFPPELEVENPVLKKYYLQSQKALSDHLDATRQKLTSDPKAIAAHNAWKTRLTPFLTANPSGFITPPIASSELRKDGKPLVATKVSANQKPKPLRKATITATGAIHPDKPLGKGESLVVLLPPSTLPSLAAIKLELDPSGLDPASLASKLGKSLSLSASYIDSKGKVRALHIRIADATAKRPSYRSGAEIIGIQSEWRLPKSLPENAPLASVWLLATPVSLTPKDQIQLTFSGDSTLPVRISLSPFGQLDPLASSPPSLSDPTLFLLSTAHDRPAFDTAVKLASQSRDLNQGRTHTLVTQSVPTPLTVRVLPRGNWQDETGPVVLPATPSFLPARLESSDSKRLTRLDLANWLTSKENPITARTVMNRLWALFFGTALSASVDDLGSQGELPSHPELLDWLASEFRDSGWDIKHMIRLIVTSHTYQQSSHYQTAALAVDPANRLLASQNPRRLEAEFVRDNALAIAGLLNLEDIGGPSVKPYQPANYYEALQFPNRDYIADTDSRQWRRGVYTHWQRTFLHPMMANFDAPARDECAAARTNSNTPQQALTLLNDPAFVEAARVFAARLLQTQAPDPERIRQAFHLALNRDPKPKELDSLTAFLNTQRTTFKATPEDAAKLTQIGLAPKAPLDPSEHAAWTQLARVLLNTQETITRY